MNNQKKIIFKFKNKNRRIQYHTYIYIGPLLQNNNRKIIESFKDKVKVLKGWSHKLLRNLPLNEKFDFAYIDGGHTAYGTLTDAVLIDPLIKPGGLIIFDDYGLKDPSFPEPQNSPELAIDSFCYIFEKQYEVIHQGWQVIIRKK